MYHREISQGEYVFIKNYKYANIMRFFEGGVKQILEKVGREGGICVKLRTNVYNSGLEMVYLTGKSREAFRPGGRSASEKNGSMQACETIQSGKP